jgi:hypothetical protein
MIIDTPDMKAYSIYCISEATTYQINSKTVPTMCPLGHAIDTDQTVDMGYVPMMKVFTQIMKPRTKSITSTSFQNIDCDFYFNRKFMTEIVNIEIISNMTTASTYDVRIYNSTAASQVLSKTLNNTKKDANILNTGNITFEKNGFLEFQVKFSGASNISNKTVSIDSIVVQYT